MRNAIDESSDGWGGALSGCRLPDPDYGISPHTGMTRAHWTALGRAWTEAMFAAIPSMDGPLVFPKVKGKSYPQPGDPPDRIRAAELEGLVRSLNLVAPLMEEDAELTVRGVRLLDYYARELRTVIEPDGPRAIPPLSSFAGEGFATRQMTCEFGGLSTILLLYPRLWETLEAEERDRLAALISDYAHGPTMAHNWRYFNVMMLLFLWHHGYPVDEALWHNHMDALLALHAGEGWFRDLHFDYYNAWVFQLYAPLWCRFYGNEHAPEIAARMEAQSAAFMRIYPLFFARDGSMPMWGRSIAYRTAAVSPIPAGYHFRKPPDLDPGWARRICSGNLLQFARRAEFLENGVPSLGFYGHFEPCLQTYSCAASPMWGHLNFLSALSLPETHPFWTEPENEGEWPGMGDAARETILEAPGIAVVNYGGSGQSELRTAKTEPDDPNYNRLAYHTAFPWEALDPQIGMAMHYTWRFADAREGEGFQMPLRMDWDGYRGGVLYRQAQMPGRSLGLPPAMDLADISLPNGVLRVDRPRIYRQGVSRLAHFGLPDRDDAPVEVLDGEVAGHAYRIARIPGRQVALVALDGWERIDAVTHYACHAEAEQSVLIYAECAQTSDFPALRPKLSLLLHKCDDSEWTGEELLPVASWRSPRVSELGVFGTRIELRDGREFTVSFEGIEGRR